MNLDKVIKQNLKKSEEMSGEEKEYHAQLAEWLSDLKLLYNLIPKGEYCYTTIETPCEKNDFKHKVDVCPFWRSIEDDESAFCDLLQEEDSILLHDQCKVCCINID